jgi:imidazolonepropionase
MRKLIYNIATLYGILPPDILRLQGKEMSQVQTMQNAWLSIVEDRIIDFGPMSKLRTGEYDEVIDAEGGAVMPCFCDPHTHLVYAGSREQEFVDKIQGLSYAEIAQRGGGILNSVDLLHQLSEQQLFEQAMRRMNEIQSKGTGCVEIKSGYGLSTKDELKILRVIRRIGETSRVRVVSTFLGAHAVSRAYKGRQTEYVNLIIREMIPQVGQEHLADYIDVFCDKGFFTPEETDRILEAGARYGMRPKIHADELAPSGGVRVAVKRKALSVDHLESMPDRGIDLLLGTETMPTCLPGTSFFLNMPYAPARQMIDRGLGIALASDYNPGSTPSGDMKFVMSLGCIKLRLLPEEAFNAVTINAAYAMGLSSDYGSITRGKVAHLILTEPIPSLAFLPYAYTSPIIKQVLL